MIYLQSFTDKEMTELGGIKKEQLTPKTYYKFSSFEYKTDGKERVLSGIEHLDYLTSGFEMGCITIWTGQTNAGKTTVMTMLIKQTIMQGEKVFFFNGEQTKDDFKNNLYKQTVEAKYIKPKQYKESCVFDFYVDDYRQIERLNRIYGENLYIFNNEMQRDINFMLNAMDEVRARDNVRVFILDNFMQIDTTTSDEYREQKQIMERLRTFAVNKNVHIHLVAHPRKMDRDNTRITIYDVLGSSNLLNKAYNVISIIRVDNLEKDGTEYKRLSRKMLEERMDINETSSILEVLKTKGLRCGLVGLQYLNTQKTFVEQSRLGDVMYERLKTNNKPKGNVDFENLPF